MSLSFLFSFIPLPLLLSLPYLRLFFKKYQNLKLVSYFSGFWPSRRGGQKTEGSGELDRDSELSREGANNRWEPIGIR
jgi:hypothetical protein